MHTQEIEGKEYVRLRNCKYVILEDCSTVHLFECHEVTLEDSEVSEAVRSNVKPNTALRRHA